MIPGNKPTKTAKSNHNSSQQVQLNKVKFFKKMDESLLRPGFLIGFVMCIISKKNSPQTVEWVLLSKNIN